MSQEFKDTRSAVMVIGILFQITQLHIMNPTLTKPNQAISFIADLVKNNTIVAWEMIVLAINAEYAVRNWMTVRVGLQAMINEGLIVRTKNVVREEYTLTPKYKR